MGTTYCFIQRLQELISRYNGRQNDTVENYNMGLTTFTEKVYQLQDIGLEYIIELTALVRQAKSDLQVSDDYLKGAAHSHSMTI